LEVNERLPCFATTAPAPAATSAAAVEMLKVDTAPPPVPQVSTRDAPCASTGTIAWRNARAAPATSSGVSPFTRRPTSSAAICAGVASPRITTLNASVVCCALSDWRSARATIARRSGEEAGWDGAGTGQRGFRACQSYPAKSRFVKYHNGLRALIDPLFLPIFRP